jgi:ubiquinone/menaquinone biosynthesis C-methylase UbiE
MKMTNKSVQYRELEAYLKAVNDPLPEMKETFRREKEILMNHLGIFSSYTDNERVLDVGCGIGRPLIDLAKRFRTKHFIGVDISECNLAIANIRLKDNHVKNVSLEMHDAMNLPRDYSGKFGLVYSTYNTIGGVNDDMIGRDSLYQFISEQSRVTSKNGYVMNFTWSRSKKTTDFLQKYYICVGLAKALNHTITKEYASFRFLDGKSSDLITYHRCDPKYISGLYQKTGIKPIIVTEVGMWNAIIGRKTF